MQNKNTWIGNDLDFWQMFLVSAVYLRCKTFARSFGQTVTNFGHISLYLFTNCKSILLFY